MVDTFVTFVHIGYMQLVDQARVLHGDQLSFTLVVESNNIFGVSIALEVNYAIEVELGLGCDSVVVLVDVYLDRFGFADVLDYVVGIVSQHIGTQT